MQMLRVLNYNVHFFPPWLERLEACFFPASYQGNSTIRFAALLSALRKTDADVILLTELWDPSRIEQLMEEISDTWPYIAVPPRTPCFRMLNSGLVLLSKLHIVEFEFEPFVESGGVDHFAGKGILSATLENGLRVMGTHTQANYNDTSKYNATQKAQVEQLLRHAASVRPQLVLGDFNMEVSSENFQTLAQGLGRLKGLSHAVPQPATQRVNQKFTEAYAVAKGRHRNYIFAEHLLHLYEDPLTETAFASTYCYTDAHGEQYMLSDHLPMLALIDLPSPTTSFVFA